MNHIEHISIQGYRRLRDIDIDLRPLNVMIGANGVGKTSFLEVLSLVASSTLAQMKYKTRDLGGFNDVLTRNSSSASTQSVGKLSIALHIDMSDLQTRLYELEITSADSGYNIYRENLRSGDNVFGEQLIYRFFNDVTYMPEENAVKPTWHFDWFETALSQTPNIMQNTEEVRQYLASISLFSPINVGLHSPIRLPQPMSPASMPGKNGEDLVSYLYTLRENHPERFHIIEDTLSAAFPDFERIGFPPVAAGVLAMTWKDKSFDKPMYMNQLSEGTLRFLWLTSLLQSPDLPAITMIDEPEVSLHPELLSLLAQLLREASERSQVFVATHSDRLIRFLKPSEVLVMDSEDGYAKMTRADSMDIEHWLEDYSLDEVWQMGQIGGRA